MKNNPTRLAPLDLFAGVFALADTVIGAIIFIALEPGPPGDVIMGVTFVLGFPAYLFDEWFTGRVPVGLLTVFWLRWLARCSGGGHFVLVNPFVWPVGILLTIAIIALQWQRIRASS